MEKQKSIKTIINHLEFPDDDYGYHKIISLNYDINIDEAIKLAENMSNIVISRTSHDTYSIKEEINETSIKCQFRKNTFRIICDSGMYEIKYGFKKCFEKWSQNGGFRCYSGGYKYYTTYDIWGEDFFIYESKKIENSEEIRNFLHRRFLTRAKTRLVELVQHSNFVKKLEVFGRELTDTIQSVVDVDRTKLILMNKDTFANLLTESNGYSEAVYDFLVDERGFAEGRKLPRLMYKGIEIVISEECKNIRTVNC